MPEDGTIAFTVTYASGQKPSKRFVLKLGADPPVRIGRAPGNDVTLDHRGVSQYHAEIRVLVPEGGAGVPQLCIRDLSMNGTGLRRSEEAKPVQLVKRTDEPLPDGSVLLVPMQLKATPVPTERAWLRVDYVTPAVGESPAGPPPAAPPRTVATARGAATGGAPPRSRTTPPEVVQAVPAAAASPDGSPSDHDEAAEKSRLQFVELLLKTKEVSAGTAYEDARKLLSSAPAWHAVDEQTRRECFDIFVEHLASHQSQKKEKKKDKEKDKDKSRKHKPAEEPRRDGAQEPPRGKRRKAGERSGSPERARKGDRRDRRARGRSGSPASRSRSRRGPQKRRRRGASDSM